MGLQDIILLLSKGVRLIQLNRPTKKNAITFEMYKLIGSTLNEDAENDQVVVTIITGTGEYFSSGNDIKSAMESMTTNMNPSQSVVKQMIDAFINYPKLLIAVVNGPAIGIASTMLPLCDVVYASNKATFETPFIRLGLCAEGCSSYTFPRTLGRSKASEMLLLNHILSAKEAYDFGLVAQIIEHSKLPNFIKRLFKYGKLPPNSLKINKQLLTRHFKNILCECNANEMDQLYKCMNSEECSNAMIQFMSRKSKL